MRGLILYFFLLVLKISLNLNLNAGYKQDGFFNALLEKDLEFVSNKGSNTSILNFGLILLLVEVDTILEK